MRTKNDKKIEKDRYDLRVDAYLSANVDTCLADDYLSTILSICGLYFL